MLHVIVEEFKKKEEINYNLSALFIIDNLLKAKITNVAVRAENLKKICYTIGFLTLH